MESFICPFAAQGKGRARIGKWGPYTPAKTVDFERSVGEFARPHFRQPIDGPVEMRIVCLWAMPRSWCRAMSSIAVTA